MTIWKRFGVNSWPTLILIDANGQYVDRASGEGNFDAVDRVIGQLVEMHKAKGELNLTPLSFTPEMERPTNGPLLYPGKVVADAAGKRLFIADTGHNRIIQTDLEGENPVTIGSGEEGFDDGDFKKASFNRPQGMFLSDETLFVADTENHAIRAVDLKAGNVTTIAGTGNQAARVFPRGILRAGQDNPSVQPLGRHPDPGRQGALYRHGRSSPDLEARHRRRRRGRLRRIGPRRHRRRNGRYSQLRSAERAGDRRRKPLRRRLRSLRRPGDHRNSKRARARSSARSSAKGSSNSATKTAGAATVRLQHCLGLAYADDHLYIADTYNNKIKICEPRNRTVRRFVGTHKAGDGDESASFLPARRLERSRFQALCRRYQQPQDQGRRLEDQGRQDAGTR